MASAPPPRERKRRKWDVSAAEAPAAPLGTAASAAPAAPGAAAHQTRRKWDVSGAPPAAQAVPIDPVAGTAPGAPGVSVHHDAAAVVARINAELQAKGVLQAPRPAASAVYLEPVKEIAREITINDAPPGVRQQLTKRHVQEEIQRRTGAVLTVKGRYYRPGMPEVDNERPLYLRITPSITSASNTDEEKQKSVDIAAGEVQSILQGQPPGRPPPNTQASQPGGPPNGAPPPGPYHAPHPQRHAGPGHLAPPTSLTLYLGFSTPVAFGLWARLAGPAGSYLGHIESATGARVSLQGWNTNARDDNAYNGLHVVVSAPTAQAVEDARRLAQSLIDTTRAAAEHEHPGQVISLHGRGPPPMMPPHQPPGYGHGHPPAHMHGPPGPYHHGAPPPYRPPPPQHSRPPPSYAAVPPPQPSHPASAAPMPAPSTALYPPSVRDNLRPAGASAPRPAEKRRFAEGLAAADDSAQQEEEAEPQPPAAQAGEPPPPSAAPAPEVPASVMMPPPPPRPRAGAKPPSNGESPDGATMLRIILSCALCYRRLCPAQIKNKLRYLHFIESLHLSEYAPRPLHRNSDSISWKQFAIRFIILRVGGPVNLMVRCCSHICMCDWAPRPRGPNAEDTPHCKQPRNMPSPAPSRLTP
mmetsp:Transcript_26252/g.65960  ORF Transcript_26252/g.65960 Transcript_26252/m.65960 type:complete len:639 (+) Transcript_26252:244-2160(+)